MQKPGVSALGLAGGGELSRGRWPGAADDRGEGVQSCVGRALCLSEWFVVVTAIVN